MFYPKNQPMKINLKNNKYKLYILISILTLASVLFRCIDYFHFEQTSILFVGIPALLAILVVKYTNKPKSIYGVTFRVITLFLLICGIFLGEGTVCILFMAPIFYGVAALSILLYKVLKPQKKANSYLLFLFLMVLAQPNEIKQEGETHVIQNSIILDKTVYLDELTIPKKLDKNLPFFFEKLKFPKPVSVTTNGNQIGNTQNIQFLSTTKGVGLLSLEVVHVSKNKIVYKVAEDSTHINHWLTWKKIEIELNQLDSKNTQITWTTDFVCDLGPSWYFEPLEKYAVGKMNNYLLSSYFN